MTPTPDESSKRVNTGSIPPAPHLSLMSKIIRWVGFATSVSLIAGTVVGGAMYGKYSRGLPVFQTVADYKPKLATRIYSTDGRLIGELGTERRQLVPYERIPKRLIQAFIATEDKKFFDHIGIDFVGLVRAVLYKVIGKSKRIGGTSTITQQLAKSLLIAAEQEKYGRKEGFRRGTERTIRRKAREMILARDLESVLNKEEIIWLYLNEVFLGHGSYGVQAASEHYFRKGVEELTLPEMALLAGLPQAPSRYSPLIDPKAARQRVKTVLSRMVANTFITETEKQEALAVDLVKIVKPRDNRFSDTAPYFTEHVRRYIVDAYGEKTLLEGGLKVFTTLDLERQHHAETAMVNGLRAVDKRQGWRGPVGSILDPKTREKAINVIEEKVIKGEKLKRDVPYLGIVTKVDRRNQWAEVQVGHIDGILPLAGMRWARKPNPNVYWDRHLAERVQHVLNKGDVILVLPSSLRELRRLAREKEVADLLPKKEPGEKLPSDPEKRKPAWARQMLKLDQIPEVEGALIAMNPHSGYVDSMIGGYAFEDSQFNRAFQACRQPGSAFKPIVYSAAIVREDYTPATMIMDTPITVRDTDIGKSWKPKNFEHEYQGEVTCRDALTHSMNVPALKTMQTVGIREAVEFAHRIGIKTELKEELGTAIGSSCVTLWELTHVYTTWARGGLRPEPVFIKRIHDRHDRVLEENADPNDPWQTRNQRLDSLYRILNEPPERIMDAVDAYLINYLLTQVATHGTAIRASRLHQPVAGKTGTTNDSFDTWFAGFTPDLVATVWVGYDTYEKPLGAREQGGRTSLPIWLEFMQKALKGIDAEPWPEPVGICRARVDPKTGSRVFENVPGSFIAPFRCGTEPKRAPVAGLSITDAIKAGGI